MPLAPTPHGQLFVWTDTDPAQEDDFNLWYDREHMAERVAIAGMPWARRYRATDPAARRYLAIYRTENMGVFTSDAYRAAFANQTEWSNRNFARMRNTQRRVMAVAREGGMGAGAGLALVELAGTADAAIAPLAALLDRAGVLRAQLLVPDAALSTPLPSEDATARVLRPVALIDTVDDTTARAASAALRAALGDAAVSGQTFRLIWSLDAADLRAR